MENEEQYRVMITEILDRLDESMLRKVWTYAKVKLEYLESGMCNNRDGVAGAAADDHTAGGMYTANDTMMQIGESIADDETHRAAGEILRGMRVPMTSENIMLAVNAIIYGRIMGRQQAEKITGQ